jgi:steroid delta-isomerase-like uncharacterized protein
MSAEQNKVLVRRFWQAFEDSDQAALNEVLSTDLVAHSTGSSDAQTREQHLQGVKAFTASFSERHFAVDELIAEGDTVATRTTMRGVHTADWNGIPASGRRFESTGITIERIRDGKIIERWFSFDIPRVMRELALTVAEQ